MFQCVVELDCGAIDRLLQRIGFMAHGNWLMALWPCFQAATQIVRAGLVAVLVSQVDLYTGQVFFVAFERALNGSTYPLLQSDAAFNMVIAIDLDLHSSSLISASSPEVTNCNTGVVKP